MEDEQIKAVRNWPEPQSVCDIQVFLGFANFYRWFIQEFSRLTASLTSMLKTTSAAGPAASAEVRDEEQNGKRISRRIKVKRSQYKKVVKAKKRLSPKSESERKNQRPPKLRTLAANQDYS